MDQCTDKRNSPVGRGLCDLLTLSLRLPLSLPVPTGYQSAMTQRLGPDDRDLALAAALLQAGECVAFPTETVYGLGADATEGEAVARIYEAKGRPSFNPLIAHVAEIEAAFELGVFSQEAVRLAMAFWPGPLTLVVPHASGSPVSELARAGLDSVGIRVPSHPIAQRLLALTGRPVAAPSANRSGHVSPTTADHVADDLTGRIAAIVDGGDTQVGVESTIIGLTGERPVLLRPGGVTREEIEALIGPLDDATGGIIAPGMMASHYAPKAAMRLDVQAVRPGEALLAFGEEMPRNAGLAAMVLNLSPSGHLAEAAANLFGYLRRLDAHGIASIAVGKIPHEGLGEAIRDRLQRAAADK